MEKSAKQILEQEFHKKMINKDFKAFLNVFPTLYKVIINAMQKYKEHGKNN